MKMCMTVLIASIAMLALTLFQIPAEGAGLNPSYDLDIVPNGYDVAPIPGTSGWDVEVRITSDINVDMYVVTQEQLTSYQVNETLNGYQERYLSERSRTFTYQGSGSGSDWVLIMNNDPSATANVHVEFKVLEEVGDKAKDACCGSTIVLASATMIATVGILYIIKRK